MTTVFDAAPTAFGRVYGNLWAAQRRQHTGTAASPFGRRRASCLGEFAAGKFARTWPSAGQAQSPVMAAGSRSMRFTQHQGRVTGITQGLWASGFRL